VGQSDSFGVTKSKPHVEYAVIPGLGRVRWHAYDEMLKHLVHCLKSEGEFDRLSRMRQLGVLAHGLSSAHHTRFEYVSLFMYLVDILSMRSGNARLSSSVEVGGRKISKSELIKLWFLLYQYAHLFDTYAAERFVVFQLQKNKVLSDAFLDGFPESCRPYCQEVIQHGRWYQFSVCLAFWRVQRAQWPDGLRSFCIAALESYIEALQDERKHGKLNEAFDILGLVRELSYGYLDIQFTDRSLLIDPVALALQVHEEFGLVAKLRDRFDARGAMLEALSAYLCETVYVTPSNVVHIYETLSRLKKRFGKRIERATPDTASSVVEHIVGELLENAGADSKKAGEFSYIASLPHPMSSKSDLSVYGRFRDRIGKRYRIYVSRWPRDARHIEIFLLHPNERGNLYEALSIGKLYAGVSMVAEAWTEVSGGDKKFLYKVVEQTATKAPVSFSRMLHRLASYLAAACLGCPGLELRSEMLERYREAILPWVFCKGVREARKASQEFSSLVAGKFGGGHLCHETSAVLEFFKSNRKKGGYYLIGRGAFKVHYNDIVKEFDGIWVHVCSADVTLYLLEAKRGKKERGADADLLTKLQDLGCQRFGDEIPVPGFGAVRKISFRDGGSSET